MKRTISLIAALIMILSVLPLSVLATYNGEINISLYQRFRTEKGFVLGDADSNGYVNALDAYTMRAYIAGFDTEIAQDAADICADSKITAKDVFYLKASFAGVIPLQNLETKNQVYKFMIADTDISEFTIVLPEGTTYDDNIYYAYELLWQYTEKATGVKLSREYGKTESAHGIYYHNVSLSSEMGEKLGKDGYAYEVKDGNLHIYGAQRGNMYATYEILEDYLGFYFCENYYTYQYKIRCASLPEGFYHEFVPPFCLRFVNHGYWGSTQRYFYIPRGLNSTSNAPQFNSYYQGGYEGTILVNCHSFCKFQAMGAGVMPEEGTLNPDGTVMSLADRYYAKYEDGLKNGVAYGKVSELSKMDEHGPQPCASNEDEYNNLFEGLLCYIRLGIAREDFDFFIPEGEQYIAFSINDNMDYCDCRVCTAKANGTAIKLNASQKKNIDENYTGQYEELSNGRVQFHKETYNGVYLDLMNRATKDIRKYYPKARLFQIIYTPGVPETVRPEYNNDFEYCSEIGGCFRHHYGDTAGCHGDDNASDSVHSSWRDEEAIPQWIKMCHDNGCRIYYWVYPESYTYFMFDMPYYYNIYYNIHWLYEQGIDGVTYEGCQANGPDKNFELMKAFVASEMIYDPAMTLDEYIAITKKYLKVRYGAGYEHIFNYLNLWEAAGRASDYCCAYWYCLFDFFDKSFFAEHYEEMRTELLTAIDMADDETKYYCQLLLAMCDFAGLSAIYETQYQNGNAQQRAHYEEIYTKWFNWLTVNNQTVVTLPEYEYTFKFPTKIDFSASPCMQVYGREYRFGKH